jgi:hypothetical protein
MKSIEDIENQIINYAIKVVPEHKWAEFKNLMQSFGYNIRSIVGFISSCGKVMAI